MVQIDSSRWILRIHIFAIDFVVLITYEYERLGTDRASKSINDKLIEGLQIYDVTDM